jgi:hypothetical protein
MMQVLTNGGAATRNACRNREHRASEHFGHERGEVQRDDRDAAGQRLERYAGVGQRVVHREQQHQQRHAAHQIEIDLDHDAKHDAAVELRQREDEPQNRRQQDRDERQVDGGGGAAREERRTDEQQVHHAIRTRRSMSRIVPAKSAVSAR